MKEWLSRLDRNLIERFFNGEMLSNDIGCIEIDFSGARECIKTILSSKILPGCGENFHFKNVEAIKALADQDLVMVHEISSSLTHPLLKVRLMDACALGLQGTPYCTQKLKDAYWYAATFSSKNCIGCYQEYFWNYWFKLLSPERLHAQETKRLQHFIRFHYRNFLPFMGEIEQNISRVVPENIEAWKEWGIFWQELAQQGSIYKQRFLGWAIQFFKQNKETHDLAWFCTNNYYENIEQHNPVLRLHSLGDCRKYLESLGKRIGGEERKKLLNDVEVEIKKLQISCMQGMRFYEQSCEFPLYFIPRYSENISRIDYLKNLLIQDFPYFNAESSIKSQSDLRQKGIGAVADYVGKIYIEPDGRQVGKIPPAVDRSKKEQAALDFERGFSQHMMLYANQWEQLKKSDFDSQDLDVQLQKVLDLHPIFNSLDKETASAVTRALHLTLFGQDDEWNTVFKAHLILNIEHCLVHFAKETRVPTLEFKDNYDDKKMLRALLASKDLKIDMDWRREMEFLLLRDNNGIGRNMRGKIAHLGFSHQEISEIEKLYVGILLLKLILRDIDYTDHNSPCQHPNPHEHEWKWNEKKQKWVRSKEAKPFRKL